ncbi:MAG: type II secretion system protein [Planctomycetota bacterium]|jgi:prepilin-type N-terminal cleavage/methylation domain-containing protein
MSKKRKGFTLVELLVVIAIIALLMGILMPVLSRVRAIAFRVVCGTNLSGLGKAMLLYANDYDDELPQAGWPGGAWKASLGGLGWRGSGRTQAFGAAPGAATVSSSLYLLVRFMEVGPKQYICKGTETTEFKIPPGFTNSSGDPLDLLDCWDFGPDPKKYCSYSYHAAYASPFALSVASSQPGMALAADRNPWLDATTEGGRRQLFDWQSDDPIRQKAGNANAHGGEGQNVLFLDSHVGYEKRAYCGVMDDNIYTSCAKGGVIQQGICPSGPADVPLHKEDSMLVNEGDASGGGGSGTTGPPGTTVPPGPGGTGWPPQ